MPVAIAQPPTRVPRVALAAGLDRHGTRTALLTEEGPLTYAELAERVRDRAAALGPGRRLVMVTGGNDLETLVSHLGALAAGHVSWLAPDRHAGDLADAFAPDVVARVHDGEAVLEERRDGTAHDLHPELAMLLGTSGSTGAPRLVRLSARNVGANAAAIAASLGITDDDRAVTTLPLHYCYGLSVVHSHLAAGACLVLTGRSVTDPSFPALVRSSGATSFAGVPHTFELLERAGHAGMDAPTLRYVTQEGGRLAPERVRRLAEMGDRRCWRFVVMYGQTEATARIPASVSTTSATGGLATLRRDARWGSGGQAVLADRALTRAESRRFAVLAEVYRDADVLVVAAGHPACAGITRGQARSIAAGRVTRWSQVVAGAPVDRIRVVHLVDGAGAPVPHMGTRWVGSGVRWRVTYATGATGAADGGVGRAAAGDMGVAALTTWSRIRYRTAGICAVPLGGVAPAEDTVASLAYPEAFPVRLVVTRAVPGRSAEARAHVRVLRREMRAHLRSPKFRAQLAQRGLASLA